jgi:hypothetical protein
MKNLKIVLFFVLFSILESQAQYGYGNGYYGSNAGPGVIRNNRIPSTQDTPKEPTPEEIEKNRVEKIDGYMALLKKDLTLDELQYIAIKNELISNSRRMDILVKKNELSEEEKMAEFKSIQEKMDKTILGYLNPAQKEKYLLLKAQKAEKKDEKKEEKKKKKNRDKAEKNEAEEVNTETPK